MNNKHVCINVLSTIRKETEKITKCHIERLQEYVDGLFSFAKFKVGDTVRLKEKITFPDGHGWKHCEHNMIKGATALVKDVDWYDDRGFTYLIMFHHQTYISSLTGEETVLDPDRLCHFTLNEDPFELGEEK